MVQRKELATISNNNLVTKSNALIEANYKLGTIEQKIILSLASKIQPTDSDFKTYNLPIKEFNKLLGLKGSPKYTELRQITRELMQKVFEVRIEKKVIQVSWLSYVAYNENDGTIDIRFDPFLRPYLLQLKREFTSYKLENVVKLKSSYSIRIYELLKQYERVRERVFAVKDLRKALGAEDIYPAYGNFKQRVLIPAQKEIRKKTDIAFDLEEIKNGRRVEKLKFIITSQRGTVPEQLTVFDDNPNDFQSSGYQRASQLALKIGFNLTAAQYKKWSDHYSEDQVLNVLKSIEKRKGIKNPIGYITHLLKDISSNSSECSSIPAHDELLLFLVTQFKNSKEKLPYWLIKDESIKNIQVQYKVNHHEAASMFKIVKRDLFETLDIKEESKNDLQFNLEQKRKELLKIQEEYKKGELQNHQ